MTPCDNLTDEQSCTANQNCNWSNDKCTKKPSNDDMYFLIPIFFAILLGVAVLYKVQKHSSDAGESRALTITGADDTTNV